jgi:two-component system cell cycle sensor histidine kinase/response regulator CckA
VLVVEDEAIVRTLLERMVAGLGYDVRAAAGGDDALALIRDGERFDLLLTDFEMPGMSGQELAAHVLELAPATKVLYMSGASVDAAGEDFLAKPFDTKELARVLREKLES